MPSEELENLKDSQKFIDWTKLKIRIHFQKEINFYFKEREVWWANLGQNIGYEENGKNEKFERPVLILKKFGKNMLWAIPLTSKQKKDDNYFHQIESIEGGTSIIMPQLRLISSKRLVRKICRISNEEFEKIKNKVELFL